MDLSDDQITAVAAQLTQARRSGVVIPALSPEPWKLAAADAIAERHADQLGWRVVGWKLGCTSELAKQILNSPGPFASRIFEGTVHASGDVVERPTPIMVESEFAFTIGTTMEPRPTPWTVEEVRSHTAKVAPAAEVLRPRVEGFGVTSYLNVVADSGANDGAVLGTAIAVEDAPELASIPVRCMVDAEVTGQGVGADALGDPWNALVWLVDHLGPRSIPLEAGQIVLSGTCAGVAWVPPGSTAVIDYGSMGEVTINTS